MKVESTRPESVRLHSGNAKAVHGTAGRIDLIKLL